jgi:hypothetical protein
LSRACLGKKIVYIYRHGSKRPFLLTDLHIHGGDHRGAGLHWSRQLRVQREVLGRCLQRRVHGLEWEVSAAAIVTLDSDQTAVLRVYVLAVGRFEAPHSQVPRLCRRSSTTLDEIDSDIADERGRVSAILGRLEGIVAMPVETVSAAVCPAARQAATAMHGENGSLTESRGNGQRGASSTCRSGQVVLILAAEVVTIGFIEPACHGQVLRLVKPKVPLRTCHRHAGK